MIKVLKGKIHRARVTDANLEYEGSITIDQSLMERAGLVEYEAVSIWNVTNGNRIETYVIKGEPNSGIICINGAAAHHAQTGDMVIIAAFSYLSNDEVRTHKPKVVFVNDKNQFKPVISN